jgi:2-aminobenzoate-CoA ligase
MAATAHVDCFARDNLPPPDLWPELLFARPELHFPERVNCAAELLDRIVAAGQGHRPCLRTADGAVWSYAELLAQANRLANVLVLDLGIVPGNRVLLRGPNTPMLVACWFAVLKAGAIVVTTMPLLRAGELEKIIRRSACRIAFCDARYADEMELAAERCAELERVVYWGQATEGLELLMERREPAFEPCPTAADDVALIAFTSGTTGDPKGTVHFHRDVLAVTECFPRHLLKASPDDVFTGSPPLAFTFGLGGLVLFPMRIGASTLLLESGAPDQLLDAIDRHGVSVLFTAPTAFRAMLNHAEGHDLSRLRKCVSAGETLPASTFEAWKARTGIAIMDGLGSTELLHIFISASEAEMRAGATGKAVPGYVATILDATGEPVPDGTPGLLAVRGPTGCRYLADDRQREYVRWGWNITGDTYVRRPDGYFVFQARADDMIICAGYNIAGPEVEEALLSHEAVLECGVVAAPDEERAHVPKAYVVVREGCVPGPELARALQEHVKLKIAPYKYPRSVEFLDALPKTETGKLQRYRLRAMAEGRV